jgi:hypothetical protein
VKELVEYLVKALVDMPEQVQISQTDGDGITIIGIKVAPEDTGKVIGKEGRIINAIRTVVKSAGAKLQKRVTVEVLAEEKRG